MKGIAEKKNLSKCVINIGLERQFRDHLIRKINWTSAKNIVAEVKTATSV